MGFFFKISFDVSIFLEKFVLEFGMGLGIRVMFYKSR